MKLNFRAVLKNLMVIIARNPVEIIISVAFFTLSVITYERAIDQKEYGENLFLAPLVFALAYLLNRVFTSGKKRLIYYLSALCAAIPFFVDASVWVFTGAYIASLAVAAAFIAIYTNLKDNARFVRNILAFAKELFFAMVIVTAVYAALMAIFFSFIYLFDLFKDSSNDIAYYTTILCYIIFAPITFLYFNSDPENKREEFRITKIFEVVINYILTPALIIYTVILYFYIAKIIISWSLPKGNLAYMVFAFIISAIIIKACMLLVSKPVFTRFFKSFSIIATAPLALFWIGSLHRVSQYGFTEERVYLIVCGAIMTLTVLLFISGKYGKYLYVGYITIVLLGLFSYMQPISAKQIGIKSQTNQLKTLATEMKMMGEDGKLTAPVQLYADSLSKAKFDRLCDIYTYLGHQIDKNLLKYLYGYTGGHDIRNAFGNQFTFESYNNNTIESQQKQFSTVGFSWIDTDVSFIIAKDTMKLTDSMGTEIIAAPLSLLKAKFAGPHDSLLVFDYENYRVVFSRISFGKDGDISSATVRALLIK